MMDQQIHSRCLSRGMYRSETHLVVAPVQRCMENIVGDCMNDSGRAGLMLLSCLNNIGCRHLREKTFNRTDGKSLSRFLLVLVFLSSRPKKTHLCDLEVLFSQGLGRLHVLRRQLLAVPAPRCVELNQQGGVLKGGETTHWIGVVNKPGRKRVWGRTKKDGSRMPGGLGCGVTTVRIALSHAYSNRCLHVIM